MAGIVSGMHGCLQQPGYLSSTTVQWGSCPRWPQGRNSALLASAWRMASLVKDGGRRERETAAAGAGEGMAVPGAGQKCVVMKGRG